MQTSPDNWPVNEIDAKVFLNFRMRKNLKTCSRFMICNFNSVTKESIEAPLKIRNLLRNENNNEVFGL